ncbi:MAG: hypothetical protein IPM15_01675 [Betaproteobacteria bacterium]|nr:hypothetical protein [Betaproteobacteria bacterium]
MARANAREARVHTTRGDGLEGGEVTVHVKARTTVAAAWLLFRWPDATRSQEAPAAGRRPRPAEGDADESRRQRRRSSTEDRFAVMLARTPRNGGDTVRLGTAAAGRQTGPAITAWACTPPATAASPTCGTGKSVRTGSINQIDDNYLARRMEEGPPAPGGHSRRNPTRAAG